MDKMKDSAPNFEFPNEVNQNNQPIGYPDLSGMLPSSYSKLNPPDRKYVMQSGPKSHSINPEKNRFASMSELQRMKLAK